MNNDGRLYGLDNCSRFGADLWGKNQFNSNFPTSLACYMRDQGKNAVFFKVNSDLSTECVERSFDEMFGTNLSNKDLYFDFESRFTDYLPLVEGGLERVDLVIRKAEKEVKGGKNVVVAGEGIRPLEVKLTVLPDSATYSKEQDLWGPEIVIRPATVKYCALSIAHSVGKKEIKDIFNDVGKDVVNWGSQAEALSILPDAIAAMGELHKKHHAHQKPLVMQPIWKTEGRAPILEADNAFDVFFWSDFALSRVFTDQAAKNDKVLSRFSRSVLRVARYFYEFGRAGSGNIDMYFASMTYGQQSDKEFSLSGSITNGYLRHPRLQAPKMPASVVKDLILDGGQKNLSPERRFDQTIYFTFEFE